MAPFPLRGRYGLRDVTDSGNSNSRYVRYFEKQGPVHRIRRLYGSPERGEIGVGPWDDGSLKLAIVAVTNNPRVLGKVALSNAVLWSSYKEGSKGGRNLLPPREFIKLSKDLWERFLKILEPEKVVAVGTTANSILRNTLYGKSKKDQVIHWHHPAFFRRIHTAFKAEDMKEWVFGRVREACNKLGAEFEEYQKLFACHALIRSRKLSG